MSGTQRDPTVCPMPGWAESRAWRTAMMLAYVVLAALPVVLAVTVSGAPAAAPLHEIGRLAGDGLLDPDARGGADGAAPWLDRPFGLDSVTHFHKGMAIFAGILLLGHPVLVAASGGHWSLLGWTSSWKVILGKVALLLLVLVVAGALLFRYVRIGYQTWRRAHKAAILVVAFGFAHSLAIEGGALQSPGMRAYWIAIAAAALGIYVYRNVWVPRRGGLRYRVSDVRQETHDTWTLTLEPLFGAVFAYRPGQFQWLKLIRRDGPSEEHPFTISSAPTRRDAITATIKESGDFTDTIGLTRPGDEARIEAPYGRFSVVNQSAGSLLFIAGGVGITPIRSMLAYLRDIGDRRPALLIYGSKSEDDIIFREEMDALPENVQVVHVLSQPGEGWQGPTGYITTDALREHAAGLLEEADVYLCGPPVMMDKVLGSLSELGVPLAHIHCERFAV